MRYRLFLNRLAGILSILFAGLLFLTYLQPYVVLPGSSYLEIFSLFVVFLVSINILFFVYWALRRKWLHLLICSVVLIMTLFNLKKLYAYTPNSPLQAANGIRIMSYNVRLFNAYQWIKKTNVDDSIVAFLKKKNPDVLCLQEFHSSQAKRINWYPYKYISYRPKNGHSGLAIFSKFPIVGQLSLDFPNTYNNSIYTDLLVNKDTVRLYNIHLESLRFDPDNPDLDAEKSKKMIRNIVRRFAIQKEQIKIIEAHYAASNHHRIVCGDFNNTPFSYVYHQLRGSLNDAFEEAGNGFQPTYRLQFIPMRIDYILTDPSFKVIRYDSFDVNLSDHNPIETTVLL